ncbi:MAG: levanase [Planctomycetota bacterium]|nr:MAG: levanase [Planctomycetota bacterium]
MFALRTIAAAVIAVGCAAAAGRSCEIVIADFEAKSYGPWIAEGDALGSGPAAGTLEHQQPVAGYQGAGLVNTYRGGDGATGTLTSPELVIERDYIAMLIGGGSDLERVGVELVIGGKTVRRATGANDELLDWASWDVREFRGQPARIRIYDRATGGWGHINVDHLVQTDQPRKPLYRMPPMDLAEYRRSADYYREPHRPRYHFTPEVNWTNDPNGLVYYDGEYHLFYQHNPLENVWGHMSWGHAVSGDMLHWRHLPVALHEEDGVMIFSGSCVVDEHNTSGLGQGGAPPLAAVYTGHREGNQSQCLAFSNDRGRTWTKYAGNPVLDLGLAEFRDPKVFWHADSRKWIMVVALAAEKRIQLYGSPDLKQWSLLSEFGPAGARNKPNWECPDLFELPVEGQPGRTRWVLVVGMGDGAVAGGSGGEYFIGEFDGKRFACDDPPERVRWLDYGRDFYAAVSWSDIPAEDGRRILLGWMNNWQSSQTPTYPWRGAMSLPRVLTLREGPSRMELVQRPIKELVGLRGEHYSRRSVALAGDAADAIGADFPATELEIVAEFELGDADEVGLIVREGDGEATAVGYDASAGRAYVDRRRSGNVSFASSFAGRHAAPLTPRDGRVRLHVFVDRLSVELFAGDGEATITDLVFPAESSRNWRVFSRGGAAKLVALDAWRLSPVWGEPEP